jgi:Rab-GTPase-TBC domain
VRMAQEPADDVVHTIEKDVPRSFPEYTYFSCQNGREDLKILLRAFAALDRELGYCQGLNFVAGCILLYTQVPTDAFLVMNVLLEHQKMRDLYLPDLRELQVLSNRYNVSPLRVDLVMVPESA